MIEKLVKITGSLENKLKARSFNLSESFIKEFSNRSGFIDFTNNDGSVNGIALIDRGIEPEIRIMNYGNELFSRDYIQKSLKKAMEYREKLSNDKIIDIGPKSAYRLVNDGSDGLSALTVDVYADYLHITTFSEYWHNHMRFISEYLLKETGKKGVYWRNNLKNSPPTSKFYIGEKYKLDEQGQSTLIAEESGMKLYIDLMDPNSTGLFLDQKLNKQLISNLFNGRNNGSILNTFAHTCAFSLAPCVNGHKVSSYNIDISPKYFNTAMRNFQLNDIPLNHHKFVEKDVFSQLEQMKSKSTRFDVIVLDPPSFAKSKKFGAFSTKNKYRDLLDLSIPLLNPGGFIVAFTNTKSISESKWLRQIGVKDDMQDIDIENDQQQQQQQQQKQKQQQSQILIDGTLKNDLREISQLNIKNAKFSNSTKNVSPFKKLAKFKAVEYFDQSPDFNIREGDERVAKYLKGVLLKNKVDFSKTKYYSTEKNFK
ncbi:hypothetical protein RB653_010621 [Dictyostelium firmibasis]|uniref:S-adenosylmethionine-dependent methyltransferase domain-containing protein n=1 Tax=Dictyostelium firmibasis TaxID=79012 RepID=A0AAN7YTT5_9MYCE